MYRQEEQICYYCSHSACSMYNNWFCKLTDEQVSRDDTCDKWEEEY